MQRTQAKIRVIPFMLLGVLLVAGCSNVKPLDEPGHADRIPDGPGLFTGKDGEMRFSIGSDGVTRERSNGAGAIASSNRTYSDQGGDEGQ